MTAPSTFRFSLACGVGGTYVDVTGDVLFEEGTIPFVDGRTSAFDTFRPGVFSFTLANGSGKYTPDHPLTTLAVPLSEGMGVCMQIGTLLLSGTIRDIDLIFPPREAADRARIRVTVDDMLGNAARHRFTDLGTAIYTAAGGFARWQLTDEAGATFGAEVNGGPAIVSMTPIVGGVVTFGQATTPKLGPFDTAVMLTTDPSPLTGALKMSGTLAPGFGPARLGTYGVWVMRTDSSQTPYMSINPVGLDQHFGFESNSTIFRLRHGSTSTAGPTFAVNTPYYVAVEATTVFSAGAWVITCNLYVNGSLTTTGTYTQSSSVTSLTELERAPRSLYLSATSSSATGRIYLSDLTASMTPVNPVGVGDTTAQTRLQAIALTTPEITLDTVPAMSDAILGAQSGSSTLDAFNEVMRGEQGYMWAETTGTLTAPVQKIKTVGRERERAIDYTFDVSEILDPIPFVRSLTNTLSEATADGPTDSATYRDPELLSLVGSAAGSDSVTLRDYSDLRDYAADRVVRGVIDGVAIQSITIDATSPLIDRWSDFAAIRLGHRLHITGLPEAQVPSGTWDGFVEGRQIDNTQDMQTDEPKTLFTYYLSPWSPVAVFDEARFSAGGTLSLQSNISAGATSLGIVTAAGSPLFTTDPASFPLDITVGDEQVTLSGVTGASSPQTAAISARGVGIVPATAHTAGEEIDVAPVPRYAY